MQINNNDFAWKVLEKAQEEIPFSSYYCTEKGTVIPVYKGTLEENKSGFTYIKVHDDFIKKLSCLAKKILDPKFEPAPYFSNGHDDKVGAHITLGKLSLNSKLKESDKGKTVYFRLRPVIEDFYQYGGHLLNGRILTVVVEILDVDDCKSLIQDRGFSTNNSHITFAMKP